MKKALVLIGMAVLALFTGCDGILKPLPAAEETIDPEPAPPPLNTITIVSADLVNNCAWTVEYVNHTGTVSYPGYGTLECGITVDKYHGNGSFVNSVSYPYGLSKPYSPTTTPVTKPIGMKISFTDDATLSDDYIIIRCNGQETKVFLSQFTYGNPQIVCQIYNASAAAVAGPYTVYHSGYMRVTVRLNAGAE